MPKYELLKDPRVRATELSPRDQALNVMSEVIEDLETAKAQGPLLVLLSRITVRLRRAVRLLIEEK